MKKIILLGTLTFILLLVSCAPQELPSEPGAPGTAGETGFVGNAITYQDYAKSEGFTISSDQLIFAGKEQIFKIDVEKRPGFIYRYGYVTDSEGRWKRFEFKGDLIGRSRWLKDKSDKTFTFNESDFQEGDNYMAAYSCGKTRSGWDCNDNKWMLQTFKVIKGCKNDKECKEGYFCLAGKCAELPKEPKEPGTAGSPSISLPSAGEYKGSSEKIGRENVDISTAADTKYK